MSLTRAQILSAPTRPVEAIECPELGGTVHLRQLSGAEVARVYAGERDPQSITQDLVALSLCDEQGARLMELGDGATLYEAHPAQALEPIIGAALRINRLTKEAAAEAGKV